MIDTPRRMPVGTETAVSRSVFVAWRRRKWKNSTWIDVMRIKADQMMAIERFLVCSVYGSSGNPSVFSDVEGVVVDEVEEERASFAKEESMLNLL
jgi:hypothetical protein